MEGSSNEPSSVAGRDPTPARRSRVAEYIAALYIALVLATPWLLRDAPLFSPSRGVEIQMSYSAEPAEVARPEGAATTRAAAAVQRKPTAPLRTN